MPLRQGPIAQTINTYLQSKGSPLAGHGAEFVQYGQQYGVDPRLLVGISGAETSLGTYGPSQRIHNPFGMGPNINYPTYGAAISALAANLAKNYFGKGLNTLGEISAKYAPVGASNDPTGLNSNWVRNVSQYYKELGGNPTDLGTAADVANYTKTAQALEDRYSGAGDSPDLTSAAAPVPAALARRRVMHDRADGQPGGVSRRRGRVGGRCRLGRAATLAHRREDLARDQLDEFVALGAHRGAFRVFSRKPAGSSLSTVVRWMPPFALR